MAVGTVLGGVAMGAIMGMGTSMAVHGFRGGRGADVLTQAIIPGAVAGAAGGYAGAALGPIFGGASGAVTGEAAQLAGMGLGGAGGSALGSAAAGMSMASFISAGGKVAVGMLSPDYQYPMMSPNWGMTRDQLKRAGMSEKEYYQALMNQDTYTARALQNFSGTGTGEEGSLTVADLMQSVDPTGLAPTEGEMTPERWKAISPIYNEAATKYITGGFSNLGQIRALSEATSGVDASEGGGPQYIGAGGDNLPLAMNLETGQYQLPSAFQSGMDYTVQDVFKQIGDGIRIKDSQDYSSLETDNSNILSADSSPSSDYYYTSSPESDALTNSQAGDSGVDYQRQQARQQSFAAERASEDALRTQSLLSTKKSLNLPNFGQEYQKASQRFTQKPKPFS